MDIDELRDAVLGYMADLETVVAEGTVDEKRGFVRDFTKAVELDTEMQEDQAQLFVLRDLAAATRYEPATAKSSSSMVAGARYAPEKKIPGKIIDFDFDAERVYIAAANSVSFVVSVLAAYRCISPARQSTLPMTRCSVGPFRR